MIRNKWEGLTGHLSESLKQNIETVKSDPRVGLYSRDIDRVDLADNAREYRQLYYTTPIVRASVNNFVSDVVEPGYRVEADSEDTIAYFEDTWLPQCAVIAGEKHNDATPFLKLLSRERWVSGGGLIEHVRPEPQAEQITGVNLIPPETVKAYTEPDRDILLDPTPENNPSGVDYTTTPRGEVAAYVQFDDQAKFGSSKNEVPLSQNDVTKTVLNPQMTGTWGTPVTQTLADDIRGLKQMLRDQEEAIKTKAYGIWSIAFDREVLEYETAEGTVSEIIEWSDKEQDEFIENKVGGADAGDIIAHDGAIEFEKFEPDIPELNNQLLFRINNITTTLPTPKYVVGFEQDINQFVTEQQNKRYEKLIGEERKALGNTMTQIMRRQAEHEGLSTSGLRLVLEPKEDESPVMTLDNETVARIDTYADAVQKIEMASSLTEEEKRELILQLPATPELGSMAEPELDEDAEQVQQQFGG